MTSARVTSSSGSQPAPTATEALQAFLILTAMEVNGIDQDEGEVEAFGNVEMRDTGGKEVFY